MFEIEQRNYELVSYSLSGGNFEGELDINGKFTGWGVWTYHNFRYEGNFVDGLPNGEGVLTKAQVRTADISPDVSLALLIITKGTFIDGYADGLISHTFHLEGGTVVTWQFEVAMGRSPTGDETIIGDNGWSLTVGDGLYYAVPPFTAVSTNPEVPSPN